MEESRIDTKLRHSSEYNLRRDDPRSRRIDSEPREMDRMVSRPHTSRRRSLSVIHQARLLDEDELVSHKGS